MSGKQKIFPFERFRRIAFVTGGILAVCLVMYLYISRNVRINNDIKPRFTSKKMDEIRDGLEKGKQFNGIKYKLLHSKWIKYFPNLIHLVKVIDKEKNQAITSAKYTMITVEQQDVYTVGSILKAKITSSGEDGARKNYGGDFFVVTLRRTGFEADGVSCEVVDKMTGEYDVNCIQPWEGETVIKVTLLHPSESIYQLMKEYSSEKESGVFINTTMVNSKNEREYTNCSLGFPEIRPEDLCDYSNSPTEKRMCIKPRSGECGKIVWQNSVHTGPAAWETKYLRMHKNFQVLLESSGVKIKTTRPDEILSLNRNTTKAALNPTTYTGWFENSKWVSLKSKELYLVESIPEKCIKGKNFYFIGDSTIRQWFTYFIKMLKLTDYGVDNSVAWSQGRDASSTKLNSHFQYRSHGPPLHNPGPEESRPYITSSINLITECNKPSYVILTIGYHFEKYDPDVFYLRIITIREAIQSLLSRCPGVKVFIKGLHYQEQHGLLCPSAWLAYRYEVLLRRVFAKLKEIVYLEYWDMSVANENKQIHPDTDTKLFVAMINYFLLHVC